MKSKKEQMLKMAGRIIEKDAKRVFLGWPPICAGALHQPKRPAKK